MRGKRWATLFLLLGATSSVLRADEAGKPSPEEAETLRAALSKSLDSIRSIRMEYTVETHPEAVAKGVVAWGPKRHVWMRQGDVQRFVSREETPGDPDSRKAYSFAEDAAYDLDPGNGGMPPRLTISQGFSTGYQNMVSPERALGLRLDWAEKSLAEAWREGTVESISDEEVGGASCRKVVLSGVKATTGRLIRLTVWLDPEHGHMARRHSVRMTEPNTKLEELAHWTWDVDEFFPVTDPFGERHWLPRQATQRTMTPMGMRLLKIQTASVNEPIPATAFRPEPPVGTQVSDIRDFAHQKHYISGGLAATRPKAEQLVKAAEAAKRPLTLAPPADAAADNVPAAPADASPPQGGLSTMIVWGSGILVLLGVAVWAVRRA